MAGSPPTEAPEKDPTPTVVIEPADNGGFVVYEHTASEVQSRLLGAFSSGAELLRGLPDILNFDGLHVEVHSKFVRASPDIFSSQLQASQISEHVDERFVKA